MHLTPVGGVFPAAVPETRIMVVEEIVGLLLGEWAVSKPDFITSLVVSIPPANRRVACTIIVGV
jgi:hypothetical protein